MMDFADFFWLIWLVAFLALEIPAAIWRPRWTLSAHVWKWFAIGKNWKEDYAGLRWFILAGITISTTRHFLFGTSAIPIIVFGVGVAWSIFYHYRHEATRSLEEPIMSAKIEEPITRKQWDRTFWRGMEILAKTHSEFALEWRREEAYRRTKRATGIDRPEAVLPWLSWSGKGGDMKFSWTKNAWKGVRGALLMAVGMAVLAFLGAFDTTGEVTAIGVPLGVANIVALIVAALIPMVRNLLKVKFGMDVALSPNGRKR